MNVNTRVDRQAEVIERSNGDARRRAYLEYCRLNLEAVEAGELPREKAAYNICGFGVQVLDDLNDEERKIVFLAGILELPEGQRTESDRWEELIELVDGAK